ncbi:hypothetical protein [Rhizorhapis sp. SPR117]|uniref:hypothetical protein n=1 Tax=Rhizorhapis sp. SPR117 TaxID=2912611 RepID=UPI001F3BF6CE|nr:hypothetical protein [Rhizorhapis sp. SPR117]
MSAHVTRRRFLTTALSASVLPRLAHAQTATVIDGKTFQGTRIASGTKGDGGEGLRAKSNMVIRNCTFLDLGNGAVRVNVPTDNLIIEDCEAKNLYRFLEDTSSNKDNPAILSHFAVRRSIAREIDHGMIRIRYGSHDGTIEDVVAYGSAQCDLYCVGFQLDDEAHDITYSRVAAHGFQESGRPDDKYWNGDGFSDERGNRGIRYISCTATQCSDGGFDLKSANVYMEQCVSRANKRNYRLWNGGELRQCRSEDPRLYGGTGGTAHFSFHGDVDHYVLDSPVVRAAAGNAAPVFLIDTTTPLTLDIRNADIDAPDAPLFAIKGPEPVINWVPERSQQTIRVLRDRA